MPQSKKIYDYDLIIIGSGAGGGVAAHIAGDKNKRVAIVEDNALGGECPNFGCVPTKALLHAAEVYENSINSKQFGTTNKETKFNYKKIKAWKDTVVLRTGTADGENAFKADGVDVIKGHGHFLSPHEISVGKKRYTAKNFLIATGTKDFIPPIEGINEIDYITYRNAIDLVKPPESIFIVGGGAIGCEFAQLLSTFGTKVHIAEYAPRLIAKEDAEVGELIAAVFERDHGIDVNVSTKVVKFEKKGRKKIVYFEKAGKTHQVTVDAVMMSTGMVANTDLGLENAGVEYTARAIKVDDTMRTTARHIYAAGDVAGPYNFTHMAAYQSRIVAHNLFERTKVKADYHAVPRCVFVTPEAASVGITESEASQKGIDYVTSAVPISVVGRSNTTNQRTGFVKVIATKQGVLIGASIVCPRAGEMIHELTLAIQLGLKAEDIASTIHAFPTWSELVRVACAKLA